MACLIGGRSLRAGLIALAAGLRLFNETRRQAAAISMIDQTGQEVARILSTAQ